MRLRFRFKFTIYKRSSCCCCSNTTNPSIDTRFKSLISAETHNNNNNNRVPCNSQVWWTRGVASNQMMGEKETYGRFTAQSRHVSTSTYLRLIVANIISSLISIGFKHFSQRFSSSTSFSLVRLETRRKRRKGGQGQHFISSR